MKSIQKCKKTKLFVISEHNGVKCYLQVSTTIAKRKYQLPFFTSQGYIYSHSVTPFTRNDVSEAQIINSQIIVPYMRLF